VDESGVSVSADTETEYKIDGVDLLTFPVRQFRAITIQNKSDRGSYKQDEQITLLCDMPGHCSSMQTFPPLVE